MAIFDATNSTEERREKLVRFVISITCVVTFACCCSHVTLMHLICLHGATARSSICSGLWRSATANMRTANSMVLQLGLGNVFSPHSSSVPACFLQTFCGICLPCQRHTSLFAQAFCSLKLWSLQTKRFHNKWQYLYIESTCNDPQVLEQNYRYKIMYSPDYKDVNTEEVRSLSDI